MASRIQFAIATGTSVVGNASNRIAVTIRLASVRGMRTFQQSDMSWSIRSRGSVARIHMKMRTKKYVFSVNHNTPSRGKTSTNGPCHAPNQSVVTMADTTVTSPYSARKKIAQRIPEYSVRKPATSSDSASGRSKGLRFVSARPAMKYVTKANGRIRKFICQPG